MSVHRLRRQLGEPNPIVSTSSGYGVNDLLVVDVYEIDALVPALRRAAGLTGSERDRLTAAFNALCVDLEERSARWPWFLPFAHHLGELRHEAGMRLARDAFEQERFERAISLAELLLDFDPSDEPAIEMVLRCLIAQDRRSDATRRWRLFKERVAHELGTEPSVDLDGVLDLVKH
jgi:DNA-binding SARP family transcriptional activator